MARAAPIQLRPPAAPRSAPNNLPAQLTSFVGRERERTEIAQLLRSSTRLVSLIGAGGVGKTRLALEIASDLIFEFPDGVWLVELAPVFDPRRVLPTMAAAAGIHEEPGRDLAETLGAALRFRQVLVVLDNCEHLIDACAEVTHRLLSGSRRLAVLATSREPLNVNGETTWRVASLDHPLPGEQYSVERLQSLGSVQLFVERATAASHDFGLTARSAASVAQICHRLDGIPLALELAAARVAALGLDEIATRLDDRFRLLVGGSRTAPPRQQTLRAIVEWSYDLLSDDERQLFERLSVFSGGWSLDAAESIFRSDVDVLARLVSKSLVSAEDGPTGTRYRMLETVRAYAAEKLRASGAEAQARGQHLLSHAQLAEEAEYVMRRATGVTWERRTGYALRLRREMDNLRAAWQWSMSDGDVEAGLRLASGLFPFFYSQGFLAEGRAWLAGLLDRTAGSPSTAARVAALSAASKLAAHHGDDATAQRYADEFEAQPSALRTRKTTADVHAGQSVSALRRGDLARARQSADIALELSQADGDYINVGLCLCHLGAVAIHEADFDAAQRHFQQALDEARAADFQLGEALALDGLASLARAQADPRRARQLYEEALDIFRCMSATLQAGQALIGLGYAALDERDCVRAGRLFGEAAEVVALIGQRQLLAIALDGLAKALQAQGRAELAEHWNDVAADVRATSGGTPENMLAELRVAREPAETSHDQSALTEREVQVARLLGQGLTNRQIAHKLVISVRTADRHVENILGKLGLRSRGAVAAWAAQHGLLNPELA